MTHPGRWLAALLFAGGSLRRRQRRDPHHPGRRLQRLPGLGAQIDHVLLSPDFSASAARFLDLADTDHRALVVDITLHQGG